MSNDAPNADGRTRVRAVLLSDRIDTTHIDAQLIMSSAPLSYRHGRHGIVTLFRYGVAVFTGLSPAEEDEELRALLPRLVRPIEPREEEIAHIVVDPSKDDQVLPGGPIQLRAPTPEHYIVIADALAKSVALARDERQVSAAFEQVEPFAAQLAERGRTPESSKAILKQIGHALLVQHRVSGRVAAAEKPDVVWDRPDLDRLYGRLEIEYELKERAEVLSRKLGVISGTATALIDIIDTRRALRLEITIVVLIAIEILFGLYQFLR